MAHLIFVCKYRKQLLTKFGEEIKDIICAIAADNDIAVIEMEADRDHIHILVEYNPKQSILEIVRLFKQITTYRIWRQNGNENYLQKHFWKERTFWSNGYFACSTGQVSKEIIEKYIESLGLQFILYLER
jgi:putative transposase